MKTEDPYAFSSRFLYYLYGIFILPYPLMLVSLFIRSEWAYALSDYLVPYILFISTPGLFLFGLVLLVKKGITNKLLGMLGILMAAGFGILYIWALSESL